MQDPSEMKPQQSANEGFMANTVARLCLLSIKAKISRGLSSTATAIQYEALLGTWLLPKATMHTATLIALHIQSHGTHLLERLQDVRGRLHHRPREVDATPPSHEPIFSKYSASEIDLMFLHPVIAQAPRASMEYSGCECIPPHGTSPRPLANLCSPARHGLECL